MFSLTTCGHGKPIIINIRKCKLCKKNFNFNTLLWCETIKLLVCEDCHETTHCGRNCSKKPI